MTEHHTLLTPEELESLKLSLATREDLDRCEQYNIVEAWQWASNRRVLARANLFQEVFWKRLHLKMFDQTWRWAGQYRKTDKNIGVPYYRVPMELKQLSEDADYWLKNASFPIDEIAVRVHHKLVWIHPFSNGNGRHARMMADLIVLKEHLPIFSWGASTLRNADETRQRYIWALKEADKGFFNHLIAFAKS